MGAGGAVRLPWRLAHCALRLRALRAANASPRPGCACACGVRARPRRRVDVCYCTVFLHTCKILFPRGGAVGLLGSQRTSGSLPPSGSAPEAGRDARELEYTCKTAAVEISSDELSQAENRSPDLKTVT